MDTLRIELHIVEPVVEKKKSWLYDYGYALGKEFAEKKKPKLDLKPLFRDWTKDYSDLETPTVFRKERKC
jgi:hypothetical protein